MNAEYYKILEDHALLSRVEAQFFWGPDTIYPALTFNKERLSLGQCAVARDYFLKRVEEFRAMAFYANDLVGDGIYVEMLNRRVTFDEIYGNNLEMEKQLRFMASYVKPLGGKALMCDWGDGKERDTGRLLPDHCWARIVDRKDMHDYTKGDFVDLTLDQYSTNESVLPPVHIQWSSDENPLIEYTAITSEEYGSHDKSLFRTEERIELLQSRLRGEYNEPMNIFKPGRINERRMQQLRNKCTQAYKRRGLG